MPGREMELYAGDTIQPRTDSSSGNIFFPAPKPAEELDSNSSVKLVMPPDNYMARMNSGPDPLGLREDEEDVDASEELYDKDGNPVKVITKTTECNGKHKTKRFHKFHLTKRKKVLGSAAIILMVSGGIKAKDTVSEAKEEVTEFVDPTDTCEPSSMVFKNVPYESLEWCLPDDAVYRSQSGNIAVKVEPRLNMRDGSSTADMTFGQFFGTLTAAGGSSEQAPSAEANLPLADSAYLMLRMLNLVRPEVCPEDIARLTQNVRDGADFYANNQSDQNVQVSQSEIERATAFRFVSFFEENEESRPMQC